MSSVTSEHGQSLPDKSAPPEPAPGPRAASWAGWLVVGLYLLAAFALTWRLWADPAGRMVAGNPGDINLFAWFMRYSATAVSHGQLPALVTTGLNAPQGINLMWNTSMLLPGVVLAPVTLLAGRMASLTILLTVGLRRLGGQPVLRAAALGGQRHRGGHRRRGVRVLAGPGHRRRRSLPAAVRRAAAADHPLRCCGSSPAGAARVRTGLWLGLLVAAQVFIGEELLVDTAVAAAVIVVVLAVSHPRAAVQAVRARAGAMLAGLGTAVAVALVICGYPLWVQFRGPLPEHGSPWTVIDFHSYLYGFVTPSGALLFHTAASAAIAARLSRAAARVPGLPGLAAARRGGRGRDRLLAGRRGPAGRRDLRAAGAVLARRRPGERPRDPLPGRAPALALAGRQPGAGANVLPDRFSILADGAVAALLAFALDRARGRAPVERLRPGPGVRRDR